MPERDLLKTFISRFNQLGIRYYMITNQWALDKRKSSFKANLSG